MSRIINDGLPEAVYLAVCNDKYNPGTADYTPSSLNEPAYLRRLKKEFGDLIVEKASSRIWALLGTAVHHIIELAGEKADNVEVERRFYGTVGSPVKSFSIGAQIDILDHNENAIQDMKVTSVWAYGKGVKPEWEQQLNVCRWCVWKETGKVVDKLNIVAIWRDWSAIKVGSPNYPDSQSSLIQVPIWDLGDTENWIKEKVSQRESAMAAEQIADIAPCTPEEQWAKPSKWAVMKRGSIKARKLFNTEKEAQAFCTTLSNEFYVEHRPGARTRCAGYCPVSAFCPNYQQSLKK